VLVVGWQWRLRRIGLLLVQASIVAPWVHASTGLLRHVQRGMVAVRWRLQWKALVRKLLVLVLVLLLGWVGLLVLLRWVGLHAVLLLWLRWWLRGVVRLIVLLLRR